MFIMICHGLSWFTMLEAPVMDDWGYLGIFFFVGYSWRYQPLSVAKSCGYQSGLLRTCSWLTRSQHRWDATFPGAQRRDDDGPPATFYAFFMEFVGCSYWLKHRSQGLFCWILKNITVWNQKIPYTKHTHLRSSLTLGSIFLRRTLQDRFIDGIWIRLEIRSLHYLPEAINNNNKRPYNLKSTI